MSFLNKITKGIVTVPHFVVIYGDSKVGKTTFASKAPDPIFLCTEDGTNNLDVARLPKPTDFDSVLAMLDELTTEKHQYKTFILDSLDHLEPLIWQKVCKELKINSIEEAGFGKGYVNAGEKWVLLFSKLKKLKEKMHVVLICHSNIKSFNDPSLASAYDRHELKLRKEATALTKENADAILFATFKSTVGTTKDGKSKGLSDGSRVMFTEYRAHHDGGNRFGLPYEMPIDWNEFEKEIKASSPENVGPLKSQIDGLLTKVKDQVLKEKVIEQTELNKSDAKKLTQILTRLREITKE